MSKRRTGPQKRRAFEGARDEVLESVADPLRKAEILAMAEDMVARRAAGPGPSDSEKLRRSLLQSEPERRISKAGNRWSARGDLLFVELAPRRLDSPLVAVMDRGDFAIVDCK